MRKTKWIAVLIAAVCMLVFRFDQIQNVAEPAVVVTAPPQAPVASAPLSAVEAEPSVQPSPSYESPPSAAPPAKPVEEIVSIPVLNYHSVGHAPDNSLVLDPVKLEKQLEYLAKEGYTPLSIDDFTLILEKRKPAPPKPVLLTFDDGYSDNYTLAMPLLRRYHFSAVVFISPDMVGTPGYLTWEQVKELQKSSWDILPHGMTHPHLPVLFIVYIV